MLHEVGVSLEVTHLECWPGQLELTFKPEFGIKACDNTFMFKEAVSSSFSFIVISIVNFLVLVFHSPLHVYMCCTKVI